MASLKQQLSQTKSQLMAARQKPQDKEQLLLYPQSDCSNLTEGIFYRQTESAFQDILHNPVMVTTLFIEQFSSRKMCFQHFAKQKKETLPMKTEALHTLTHTLLASFPMHRSALELANSITSKFERPCAVLLAHWETCRT